MEFQLKSEICAIANVGGGCLSLSKTDRNLKDVCDELAKLLNEFKPKDAISFFFTGKSREQQWLFEIEADGEVFTFQDQGKTYCCQKFNEERIPKYPDIPFLIVLNKKKNLGFINTSDYTVVSIGEITYILARLD